MKLSRRNLCLLLTVAALSLSRPDESAADTLWGFVQITCAPEIGYFSVRRFQVPDLPEKGPYLTEGLTPGPEAVAALQHKYGIYDSKVLKEHPFKCSIPAQKLEPGWNISATTGFSVQVDGHLDENSEETTYARIRDDAEVFLNNKSVALLPLNPWGFTKEVSTLEISQVGLELRVYKCSVEPDNIEGNKLVCGESYLAR